MTKSVHRFDIKKVVTVLIVILVILGVVAIIVNTISNNAYINSVRGTIQKFAGTGDEGTPTVGSAVHSKLDVPRGVAVDDKGIVYIADSGNSVIERIDSSGKLTIYAGNGTTAKPTPGPASKSSLCFPAGMATDKYGNLFVADMVANMVVKITPDGILTIFAGTGKQASPSAGTAVNSNLNSPTDVAADIDGNIYIADFGNNTIDKVDSNGILSIFAGTGSSGTPNLPLFSPWGIDVDYMDNVYVADSKANSVLRYDPKGVFTGIIAGTSEAGQPTPGRAKDSKLNYPTDVAFNPTNGDIYIADSGNNLIERVKNDGTLSIIAGNGDSGMPTFGALATSSSIGDVQSLAIRYYDSSLLLVNSQKHMVIQLPYITQQDN